MRDAVARRMDFLDLFTNPEANGWVTTGASVEEAFLDLVNSGWSPVHAVPIPNFRDQLGPFEVVVYGFSNIQILLLWFA